MDAEKPVTQQLNQAFWLLSGLEQEPLGPCPPASVTVEQTHSNNNNLETTSQTQPFAVLCAILNASPDGFIAINPNGHILYFNQPFIRLWDIDPNWLQTAVFSELNEHCISQIAKRSTSAMPNCLPIKGVNEEIELLDGRIYEYTAYTQPLTDAPLITVVIWRDVTRARKVEALNMRLSRILERSQNEIYLFNRNSLLFSYANAGAIKNLGYDIDFLLTLTPVDIKPDFDELTFRQMIHPLLSGEKSQLRFETVHQRADGSQYDVQVHLQIDDDPHDPQFLALILDITERKKTEALIWRQANFDSLTQLPNRVMLQDRMTQELARAKRNNNKLAILFIDLDKFKEVNDTLGHDVGDLLLIQATQRILNCVRSSDTVARMGGDEFVVLMPDLIDAIQASHIAQKLIDQLRQPFKLDDKEAVVSASIGIAVYPDDAIDELNLLKCADQSMYVSKDKGRDQFVFFTRDMEVRSQRRSIVLTQLRNALERNELYLNFQPIFNLAKHSFTKAEALLRWHNPELGEVSPAEFIPLAEESGLIIGIGEWVFDEAARWIKHWRDTLQLEIQVSVNKSPVQFSREISSFGRWADKLKGLGLPGNSMIMEITEGVLMEANADITSTLFMYRNSGIEVAIDDFGTGYSSLAYLRYFDIDYLKIDKSFISRISPGSNDLILTQAIIAMAHALGLRVVAEGVETQEQLKLLVNSGCDFAQGYFLSKPIMPAQLEALLVEQVNSLGKL